MGGHAWLFALVFLGGGVTGWLTSKPLQRCFCLSLRNGLLTASAALVAGAAAGTAYFWRVPDRSGVDTVALLNCAVTTALTLWGMRGLWLCRPQPVKGLSAWLALSLLLWLGYGGAVLSDPAFFCRRAYDASMHACVGKASLRATRRCIEAVGDYGAFEERCQFEHSLLIVGAVFATVAFRFVLWSIILLIDSGDLAGAGGALGAAGAQFDIELHEGALSPRHADKRGGGGHRAVLSPTRGPVSAIELQDGAQLGQRTAAEVRGHAAAAEPLEPPSPKLFLAPSARGRGGGGDGGTDGGAPPPGGGDGSTKALARKGSLQSRVLPGRVAKLVMVGDVEGVAAIWRSAYASCGFRVTDPNTGEGYRTTPLHAAAAGGHLATVQWLLDHGCVVSVVDGHGQSPKDVASDPRVAGIIAMSHKRGMWEFV